MAQPQATASFKLIVSDRARPQYQKRQFFAFFRQAQRTHDGGRRKKLPPLSCTSCTLCPHACLKNVHRKLMPVLQATAIFKRFLHLPTLSRIYREICPHKHTHENWRNTRDRENTSPLLTCPSLILLTSLSSFTTNFCVFAKLLKWPPIHVASQPTHFSRRWSIFFPTHHNVFLFFFVSFFYACAIYPDNL